MEQMKSKYEEDMEKTKSRGKAFGKHRLEYRSLKDKLETLTDKTSHQVMVPFTKKAFMPGRLIHTNEILVLLGENWFVERSAKQAREICERRLERCEETLLGLDKEIKLYESWLREATQLAGDTEQGQGEIEIREPYDEDEVKRWKEKHKETVRAHREKAKEKVDNEKDEDSDEEKLWKRLDELELEEELEEHLARTRTDFDDDDEPESDSSDEDEEESDQESNEEDSQDEKDTQPKSGDSNPLSLEYREMERELEAYYSQKSELSHDRMSTDRMSETKPDRKVSFGEVKEHVIASRFDSEPVVAKNVIQFDHSENLEVLKPSSSKNSPENPGDLYQMFETQLSSTNPRSILKPGPEPSIEPPSPPRMAKPVPVFHEPAVANDVMEREVDFELQPTKNFQPPTAKKQSLFKQHRAKK